MKMITMRAIFFILLIVFNIEADVKSTTGTINFNVNNNSNNEMILNSNGLGIGVSPSANLHVQGNAIVTQSLTVGSSSGSGSNLYINGTVGYGIETVATNSSLDHSSVYLVDTATASDNIWLDLPYAGNVSGREIKIKKISNDYRVTVTAATNIDTSTSIVLSTSASALPFLSVISDGEQWYTLDYIDSNQSTDAPTSIDNLMLWLDANNGASLTHGTTGNVSQWSDLSGHDRHATQAADDLQPAYENAVINGLSALKFNEEQLDVTSGFGIVADESRTIIFVAIPESGYNNSEIYGTSTSNMADFGTFTSNNRLRLRQTTSNGYSSAGDVPYDFAHMITITASSGNTSAYNGVTNIISSTNEYQHFDLSGSVGIGGASFATRRFKGYIGEFIVYNRVLSSSELNQLWQYLAQKWGVSY